MGNSPRFAFNVVACAALAMLFWAASAGVGYRILPGVRARPQPDDVDDKPAAAAVPASWRQPGIAACVGLGALLLLGGFGVLLRIPWWLIVVPFLVAGLVLVMLELRSFSARQVRIARSALVLGGLGVVAFGLVALVEAPLGFRFHLNGCDDWRAYLPYARRLLATNGLEEPWSSRRVQSLGGFDLLRAMPVAVFGDVGVGVAETVIASVFLAGLFVANGVRSVWARLLSVGLILAIPLLWIPRTNTTGVLMGCPLLVAVFAATVELRKALRAGDRRAAVRWAAAAGLVIAALMAVRPNLAVLGAAVLAVGAVTETGTRLLARLMVAGAGAVSALVALAPWSIAMWRTAGTPLYPLFRGNLNRDALGNQQVNGVGDLAGHVYDLMRAGPYLWVTVGVLVMSLVAWKLLPDAPVVALAAVAAGVVTAVFAMNTPFVPWMTFIRYIAPMSAGLAVFLVCELMRGADALPVREPSGVRRWIAPALGITAGVVLAGVAFSSLGFEMVPFTSGARLVVRAATDDMGLQPDHELSPPGLRDDFRRAFAGIDPDRTITAVDRPYLIDYSRYDVPNLDAPGFMTADGGEFPFFTGPGPKISRLRRAGYDTLIATSPLYDLCLDPVRLEAAAAERPDDRKTYDRFLDWGYDLQRIAVMAPAAVRRVGPLLVIDLPRAQRDLQRATVAS